MAFGDPSQQDHMMRGVRAAFRSPNTPLHLRPHLGQRLAGSTATTLNNPMQMAAQALKGADLMNNQKKPVFVGSTGMTPVKAVAGSTAQPVRKAAVGSTAQPVRKAIVSAGPTRPIKTIVGSTAQPVHKSMPGSYGGSNGPRPRGVLASPNSAARPSLGMRPRGNSDGNLGKSVAPMPKRPSGAANPVLDWKGGGDFGDAIKSGGMGQTGTRKKNSFYGE